MNNITAKYRYSTDLADCFDGFPTEGRLGADVSSGQDEIRYVAGEKVVATVPKDAFLTERNIRLYREAMGVYSANDLCKVNETYNNLVWVRDRLDDTLFANFTSIEDALGVINDILDELHEVQYPTGNDLLNLYSGAEYEWPIPVPEK